MKKIIYTLLVIFLITLSGCKSEEVRNVENLIAQLEEKIEAVNKAEFEYNKLSKEDKEKVDNYDDLISMKKKIYSGVYQRLSANDYIDGKTTRVVLSPNDDWEFTGNKIKIGQYNFTVTKKFGVTALIDNSEPYDTKIFVKTQDAKDIYEKAFLKVDLTLDNYYDYFGVEYVGQRYDEWGEPEESNYIIYSKAYQNGYIVCGEKNAGVKGPTISYDSSLAYNTYVYSDKKIEKVKGTVYYVHKDYVTSYIFTSKNRSVSVFGENLGELHASDLNTKYPW